MSLDLPQVITQVQQFGRAAAERIKTQQDRLPSLVKAYASLADLDTKEINASLAGAAAGWQGALPSTEPMTEKIPPADELDTLEVVATDGSQIYPDRHDPILYYLINIGGIRLAYGRQGAPLTFSRPSLHYSDRDLYEAGHLISPSIINAQRDVAEMMELAELASGAQGAACLAILDNSLILRLASGDRGQISKSAHRLIKAYVDALSQLQQTGANLAGFIDRPGATDLLSTISLVSSGKSTNLYSGLTDRNLMSEWLEPGQRSAIFRWKTPDFPELSAAGHELSFFYLHLGTPGGIARVEIPDWVASDPGRIAQVHAGLLRDSRATGGFPYSLIRAHELAVVTQQERNELQQWLLKDLIDRGLPLVSSQKAATKGWLGRPRRHSL